jgi:hypothetical protein
VEALLTLRHASGASEAVLREKIAKTRGKIEVLESRKKEIASSDLDHDQRLQRIRALAEEQNVLRRETNLALVVRQLGLVENAKRALDLFPCMVDYVINIDLGGAFEQWEAFLDNVGDLRSDIDMRTRLDEQFPAFTAQSSPRNLSGE